jgi:hypothetical protein
MRVLVQNHGFMPSLRRYKGKVRTLQYLPGRYRVRFAPSQAAVVGIHWLVGVGNGSSHLLAHSSETFACIAKPGWIFKAGSTRDFSVRKCYHHFYTQSGGLTMRIFDLKVITHNSHLNNCHGYMIYIVC